MTADDETIEDRLEELREFAVESHSFDRRRRRMFDAIFERFLDEIEDEGGSSANETIEEGESTCEPL